MKPPYFTINGSIVDGWRVMKYAYVFAKGKDGVERETDAVTAAWLEPKQLETLSEVGTLLKEEMKDFV
jgi:hypothetical protein